MKRILTVQDISCVGKCSGTVAVPVLSAMGIEAAVLPTAVLSTHTGFKGFTFRDLTDDIEPIAAHWRNEDLRFDAFYSGYLGSKRQVQLVKALFTERRRPSDPILVDPAMADHGKFYVGFTPDFAKEMLSLCAVADIAVPNITELCFLLEKPYKEHFTMDELKKMLRELCALGTKQVVLTGVESGENKIGALLYDKESDTFALAETDKQPAMFHGTGDLFASALLGALCNGFSAEASMALAVDYIAECIRVTIENPDHVFYGVEFERVFPWLLKRLGTL